MTEEHSYSDCKKKLVRSYEVVLPQGESGIFLELAKGGVMAWVLVGNLDGPKKTVPLAGLIKATFGVEKGRK